MRKCEKVQIYPDLSPKIAKSSYPDKSIKTIKSKVTRIMFTRRVFLPGKQNLPGSDLPGQRNLPGSELPGEKHRNHQVQRTNLTRQENGSSS